VDLQGGRKADRRFQRRAGRERGPKTEELVAVSDRPGMGCRGELPHARRPSGQQPAQLAEAVSDHLGLRGDTGARRQGRQLGQGDDLGGVKL